LSVLVAFAVTPLGVGEDVGEIVAEAVKVVRASGLPNQTDAKAKGIVFKKCWCEHPVTGRRGGRSCPRLAEDGHGSWYFDCSVKDMWGRRRQVRRGGFGSRTAAVRPKRRQRRTRH